MWNPKSKVNEQTKQKHTLRYREQTEGCQVGEGPGGWVKKVKGLRSLNGQLQNSHRDGCTVQQREYSQSYFINYVWCQVGTGIIRRITS